MSVQELKQAVRRLWQQPLFAGGVIAVLAVAIGANTAMFTVVDSVLMRPLPLREPADLVTFTIAKPGTDRQPLSLLDLADFKAESRTLEAIVATFGWSVNLTGLGEAERLQGMRVSPEYFEVTGAGVALGRAIQPADEHQSVAADLARPVAAPFRRGSRRAHQDARYSMVNRSRSSACCVPTSCRACAMPRSSPRFPRRPIHAARIVRKVSSA